MNLQYLGDNLRQAHRTYEHKISPATRTPPVFKSLTNTIYDAGQKVGNQNSENILKFLTQDALNQLLQLCLIDLEALE